MEMNAKKSHHQFYLPWYAGDDESNSWITYLHRNLHHVAGEDHPFSESEWKIDEDDARIHGEALDALYSSDKVDASLINVFVLNKNILLTGKVLSEIEKEEAEVVVRRLKEVWSVTNELEIQPVIS
jgi:hypothetical protein